MESAVGALVAGRSLDVTTTYYAMEYVPETHETNPVYRGAVDFFGILPGNIIMFLVAIGILVSLALILNFLTQFTEDLWYIPSFLSGQSVLVVIGGAFFVVGLNNLYLILTLS